MNRLIKHKNPLVFGQPTLFDLKTDKTLSKTINRLTRAEPVVYQQTPAVSAMRRVLFETAKEYYKNLIFELERPIMKYEIMGFLSLREWPVPGEWEWPTARQRSVLKWEYDRAAAGIPRHQTKKTAIMRWVHYDIWVLNKLAKMDELLRTGQTDEFIKLTQNPKGEFKLKRPPQQVPGRTLIKPHFPNQTHEYFVLKKEWEVDGQSVGSGSLSLNI